MTDKRCAFLRMADTTGWSIDADLAFAPLAERGWDCDWLAWQTPGADWDSWDAVYLAATWDYPDEPGRFLEVLEAVDRSRAVLVNPLELVRWNLAKTYLRDLESRGAAIVPSAWFERFDAAAVDACFDAWSADRLIIKPVVSTNAAHTWVLRRPVGEELLSTVADTFRHRAHVVQPFIDSILTEGEYSLFYIGGEFTHGIRKVPAPGDFRVQEEHGASIAPVTPEASLLATADRVMATVRPAPVYARCDFVRDAAGAFRVMELELIEPSLYLRMCEAAAPRFADALDRYVRGYRGADR